MTHSPRPSVRSGEISLADIALGLLLIAAGAASRIWFRDIPNFQPVAAIGLFAGYYFRSRWLAGAVPLAALVASDLVIGGYQWQMMVVVYAMIALPALVGPALRRFFPAANPISAANHRLPGRTPGRLAARRHPLLFEHQFRLVALVQHVRQKPQRPLRLLSRRSALLPLHPRRQRPLWLHPLRQPRPRRPTRLAHLTRILSPGVENCFANSVPSCVGCDVVSGYRISLFGDTHRQMLGDLREQA
jgi:hypothetical protein